MSVVSVGLCFIAHVSSIIVLFEVETLLFHTFYFCIEMARHYKLTIIILYAMLSSSYVLVSFTLYAFLDCNYLISPNGSIPSHLLSSRLLYICPCCV